MLISTVFRVGHLFQQNRYVTALTGVCRKTFVELFIVKRSLTQGTSDQNFFWQGSPLDEKYYRCNQNFFWQDSHPLDEKYY